jgi:tRNA(Leu) C34 or U34 (ribose-2'-O)-methylase TrmL
MEQLITIPMNAPVESLNVGVAAALVLCEAFRQRDGGGRDGGGSAGLQPCRIT